MNKPFFIGMVAKKRGSLASITVSLLLLLRCNQGYQLENVTLDKCNVTYFFRPLTEPFHVFFLR